MAYSTTLDQKRRDTLRRQLYGKEVINPKRKAESVKREESSTQSAFSYANTSESITSTLQPTTYLTRDLTKILIYSAIAVATQFTLYFAINHHLVKLPI